MDVLALRLNALDPEAAAALRVVTHFDALLESRAGLQSIVSAAAALAGCPARLADPPRRLVVRVLADGAAAGRDDEPDPAWLSAPVTTDATLWLERTDVPGPMEAMVLERAAAAARAVLGRTRARHPTTDPASIELVLDATASRDDRLTAASRLGLPAAVHAVALADGTARLMPAGAPDPVGARAGLGPAVAPVDLPGSYAAARLALRLTAEGTADDPGPRVVHADCLGALALLVRAADTVAEPIPDVGALDRAAVSAPWALATLEAFAGASSVRDASRALGVHHSTVQDRLGHAEAHLGWSIRDQAGRLRLQLALVLRRSLRRAE